MSEQIVFFTIQEVCWSCGGDATHCTICCHTGLYERIVEVLGTTQETQTRLARLSLLVEDYESMISEIDDDD